VSSLAVLDPSGDSFDEEWNLGSAYESVTDVVAAYERGRDFVTDKPMGIAFTARGVRFTGNRVASILEAADLQAPKPART